MPAPAVPPLERFWPKVNKNGPVSKYTARHGPCWIWTACTDKHGYGRFFNGIVVEMAYRFAYREFVDEIPDGYEVDHVCRVPACVNPEHLQAVTQHENNKRSDSPPTLNGQKQYCAEGHPLDYVVAGKRNCRPCKRAAERRNYRERAERKRAATRAEQ